MKSLPALLLAALSLAVAAPSANATIVIGQSVAGVQLSATRAQVNRKLGPPVSHIGPELLYPESVGLRVRFKHGRVVKILSYLQRQQTSGGITIGSRRAQLARFYPHAKCQEGHSPAYLYCVVAATSTAARRTPASCSKPQMPAWSRSSSATAASPKP